MKDDSLRKTEILVAWEKKISLLIYVFVYTLGIFKSNEMKFFSNDSSLTI